MGRLVQRYLIHFIKFVILCIYVCMYIEDVWFSSCWSSLEMKE